MTWTSPTQRSTGFLVTASVYNTDIIDNLSDLRGSAGTTTREASIVSDTHNTDDLGSAAIEWKDIFGVRLHAGRQRFGGDFREAVLNWEDDAFANIQVTNTATGGGSETNGGGTGQMTLKVDDDAGAARSAQISQQTETVAAAAHGGATGLDNSWTPSKRPYMRAQFSLNVDRTTTEVFIGFRTTPGIARPTTEHHAGIQWTGTEWQQTNADGSTQQTTPLVTTPTAGSRNVVEVYINSSTDMEIWVNGVREAVETSNLPSSNLEWDILVNTDGAGGATDSIMSVGKTIFQEDVP